MSISRTRVISLGIFLVTGAGARSASAHHEAWVLRDSGTQCAFEAPSSNTDEDNYYLGLFNGASYERWMSCPVSLAARWASSAPVYSAGLWARASAAVVYVANNQSGQQLACQAEVKLASGALRFSRTVSTTAGGDQRLTPNSDRNWGGDLEAYKGDTVRGMVFSCLVPPNYSGVYGYKVRMCIRNAECQSGDGAAGETWSAGADGGDSVQTSGIACLSASANLVRDEGGLRNVGAGYASVFCPIVPPADDTKEASRRLLSDTTVYYRGAAGDPWTEPPPTCQLVWRNRTIAGTFLSNEYASGVFERGTALPPSETAKLASVVVGAPADGEVNPRADLALMVLCDLPPGYTIKGVTSLVKVTPVAGGL